MVKSQQGPKVDPQYNRSGLMERANLAAASRSLDELLEGTLRLFSELCRAENGTFYIYRAVDDHLHYRCGLSGALQQDTPPGQTLPL